MPLRAIAYASEAISGLSIDHLDDLIRDAARSHHEFVELGRGHVARRFFPYWSMQMLPAEPHEIRRVAQGDWSWLSRAGGLRRLEEVVLPHVNR